MTFLHHFSGHVWCTTSSCERLASRYLTCCGEGSYPYCSACANHLTSNAGEHELGLVERSAA